MSTVEKVVLGLMVFQCVALVGVFIAEALLFSPVKSKEPNP